MTFEKWFEANWWKVLIVYVVVGLLTFGNVWNDSLKCAPLPKDWRSADWDIYWDCTHPNSVIKGVFWPIYFVGEAAIYITK